MHPTRIPWLLVLAAALACSTPPRGSQNEIRGSEHGQIVTSEKNRALAQRLAIVNPLHRRRDGYLEVQFELQNKESRAIDFAWAIDWFDQAGFHIDAGRQWKPVSIGGFGSTTLTAVAPHPDATSWKLQITSRDEVQ
jgi:uncharacterized protein YcfL